MLDKVIAVWYAYLVMEDNTMKRPIDLTLYILIGLLVWAIFWTVVL